MSQKIVLDNELPRNWTCTTLHEIALEINSGFSFGDYNTSKIGIPHIRPANIRENGTLNLSEIKYAEVDTYDALQKGDILFNNTNSHKLLGKTALVPEATNWAYSNLLTRIRTDTSLIRPSWIVICLNHLYNSGFFKMKGNQHVNQSSISKSFLQHKIPIPIPPFEEQCRIENQKNLLFPHIHSSEDYLEKLLHQSQLCKTIVLYNAFNGKLTKKWRIQKKPIISETG